MNKFKMCHFLERKTGKYFIEYKGENIPTNARDYKEAEEAIEKIAKKKKKTPKEYLDELFDLVIIKKNESVNRFINNYKKGTFKRAFKDVLSIEEEAILRFYTTPKGYKDLNKALELEELMTDFLKAQNRLMNKALDKLPNYKTKGLLYRAENIHKSQIDLYYEEGTEIIKKAFTSSTYSHKSFKEIASMRPDNLVIIRINGKNGKLIEDLAAFKSEKEVLFKSGTTFDVSSIRKVPHPITKRALEGQEAYVIILKEK